MIESLLISVTPISTFAGAHRLTNASGCFFERDGRLFVVTSRHVVCDEPTDHRPDHIQIELHVDASNLAATAAVTLPLYRNGLPIWKRGLDRAGEVDVAVVQVDRELLPPNALFRAFTPQHLPGPHDNIEVGTSVILVGFPLGFYDTLHRLPVARQAIIASSFGLRFQGEGYFLTDARTHRGSSGAPVVMRVTDPSRVQDDLPWMMLGIHAARLDMRTRDEVLDEALGLNCAWYADILLRLTDPS